MAISSTTCIVRDTAAKKGRHIVVAPGMTAAKLLHCGRVILGRAERR